MTEYFVVAGDGREYGPVDLPGLLQWVRDGRVLGATLIRKDGAAPAPAETFPELAVVFAPPPPKPALPPIVTTAKLPSEFQSWTFIEEAWNLVKPYWLPLAAMQLIAWVIGSVPYVGPCAMFVIGGAIYVGINRALLGLLAGREPKVEMMFEGFDRFAQAFLATLIVSVCVGTGLMFCIVPGVILAIMWMFVSLILAETELDFWPALNASANLTVGYKWELFCFGLACMVVLLLGLLACCVGVLVAQPVVMTAMALVYRFLQARQTPAAA